jgi:hypothetical protein
MRDRKILKSLKYLVLTAAILIGATGISNAEETPEPETFTFTATGEVCDTTDREQDTIGALVSVDFEGVIEGDEPPYSLTESAITIEGFLEPGDTVDLPFGVTITPPQQCNGRDSEFSSDYIDVYVEDTASLLEDTSAFITCDVQEAEPCDTSTEDIEVQLNAPMDSGAFGRTIEFTYTAAF